jgi:integration host factor subunit beta
LSEKLSHFSEQDVELAVKRILEVMSQSLSEGYRIEIRGFGSFSLHKRSSFLGRNPRTGESVTVPEKYLPYFKPGKLLQDRVNEGFHKELSISTSFSNQTAPSIETVK